MNRTIPPFLQNFLSDLTLYLITYVKTNEISYLVSNFNCLYDFENEDNGGTENEKIKKIIDLIRELHGYSQSFHCCINHDVTYEKETLERLHAFINYYSEFIDSRAMLNSLQSNNYSEFHSDIEAIYDNLLANKIDLLGAEKSILHWHDLIASELEQEAIFLMRYIAFIKIFQQRSSQIAHVEAQ